jgi:hypothetical protein
MKISENKWQRAIWQFQQGIGMRVPELADDSELTRVL